MTAMAINRPRALLHYFSGTGNTARAMECLKKKLEDAGWEVQTQLIDDRPAPPDGHFQQQVFAFPVYAGAAPEIFFRYLRQLPRVERSPAVVLAIIGDAYSGHESFKRHIPGHEGWSLLEISRLLRRKGFDVQITASIGYPHNLTFIASPLEVPDQERVFQAANQRLCEIAAQIVKGEHSIRPLPKVHLLWAVPFGLLYSVFGRHFLGKMFVADDRCTACDLCQRSCPAQAIGMLVGRPRWNLRCQGCQRCINLCPQRSIQTSLWRLIMLIAPVFLPYNPWFRAWTGVNLQSWAGSFGGFLLEVLVWSAGYLLAVLLLDLLLTFLERVPGLRRLFQLNYTHRFRRYLAPGFRPASTPITPARS